MSTSLHSLPAEAVGQCDQDDLRIALMVPNLEIGGSQEVVRGLARSFARPGCQPVVCALFQGGPLERDLAEQGTVFEVLDLPRRPIRRLPWFLADMWRMWWRLRSFVNDHDINVIQTNSLGSQDFLVLALARYLKIPVVTFIFHDGWHRLTALKRQAYRTCRRWTSDYVAVSPETKTSIIDQLKVAPRDVTVICNGVEVGKDHRDVDRQRTRSELGLRPDAKLLITVGTLKEQKGHRYLIQAAMPIIKREPRAHLVFVGDGILRDDLQQQVAACGLAEHVHFLGSRRDVLDLLRASDIFILPSLVEGLSIALLEAMAAEIPVIATAVAGTSTVLDSDRLGVLVPPGDAVALADATIDLLGKPKQELKAQCAAARQRITQEFSLDRQADEYLALCYRRLAATSPLRRD